MIVILLGAPGAGKGTQSKMLAAKYGFKHLATGDIFRGEIAAKTPLGQKAQEYVKSGKLVPDNLVTEMVAGKLEFNGTQYLLDGFPRTLDQAQSLDKFLAPQKATINVVIYLNLPHAEAISRLSSRRVCSKCGEVYNITTRPPAAEGKCDACGGDVVQREDDSEATAKKRIMVFEDLTHPLVAYYKAEQVFHEVNAAQSPEKVSADLFAVIDQITAAR
jgi:adenylate kinase